MNLPNKITMSRIFMVPIFLLFIVPIPDWIILSENLQFIGPQLQSINNFIINYGSYVGAVIFILAASTDGVDGYIARKYNIVTKFGIFLDPIADKLIVTSALIGLLQRNEVSAWAVMIIIAREFVITGFRLIAMGENVVLAANKWGKLKTITQIVAISFTLLKDYPLKFIINFPFHQYLMFIAVIITIYSGYTYISTNWNVLKSSEM